MILYNRINLTESYYKQNKFSMNKIIQNLILNDNINSLSNSYKQLRLYYITT